jgi:hypothetical protein
MPASLNLDPVFREAGLEWNVDPQLLKAMAQVESSGNPRAVAPDGGQGLMQIMPATQRYLGVTNPFDPVQSIWGAAKYMAEALDREGTPERALAYYHGGPEWRSKYGPISAAYVPKVAVAYNRLGAAAKPAAQPQPAQKTDATDDFLTGKTAPAAPAKKKEAAPAPAEAAPDSTDDFLTGKTGPAAAKPDATPTKPDATPAAPAATPTMPSELFGVPDPDAPPVSDATKAIGNALKAIPTTAEGARNMLADKPGWTSSSILPMRVKNDAQGNPDPKLGVEWDLGPLRPFGRGVVDLADAVWNTDPANPRLSPEATSVLFGAATGGQLLPSVARGTGAAVADTAAYGGPLNALYGKNRPAAPGGSNALSGDAPMPPAPTTRTVTADVGGKQVPVEVTEAPTAGGPQPGMGGPQPAADEVVNGWRRRQANEPLAPGQEVATDAHGQEWVKADTGPQPQPAGAPSSVGAKQHQAGEGIEGEGEIPEPTPAQKATALQKMVNQSAEDRLTPQGRDDHVYVPGVERPEAMRDFSSAPEGQMSTALKHKVLYNTDSNYHDRFDAQIKKNNAVMVDYLHDMIGDANTRKAAMEDAEALMPGSVELFKDEKPVDITPVAEAINKILTGPKGKIDGVISNMRNILSKLYDRDGNPETMPSMIKGIFDDVNNKLYDRSPTKEGNEARQAREQLLEVKAALSKVIGSGLPGTKWSDYLTNLSAALGKVSKYDFMQQYLTGPKKLTNQSGELQLTKVQKMLDDIEKHHKDRTGGAKEMTMEEINRIEGVRNELQLKKLLDDRAGVRGSPTVQLGTAAGILGSGPLGSAVKTVAEGGAHLAAAHLTAGIGNVGLLAAKGWHAGRKAKAEKKAANALAATKERLLDTSRNPLSPD